MSELYDRPTAAELIAAVREFIEADVMDATDGRLRFHARVAGNVLAMIERELTLGADAVAAHQQRLGELGVSDDRELAALIRAGDMDVRWNEVIASVRESVAAKLAVAHPGYTE